MKTRIFFGRWEVCNSSAPISMVKNLTFKNMKYITLKNGTTRRSYVRNFSSILNLGNKTVINFRCLDLTIFVTFSVLAFWNKAICHTTSQAFSIYLIWLHLPYLYRVKQYWEILVISFMVSFDIITQHLKMLRSCYCKQHWYSHL